MLSVDINGPKYEQKGSVVMANETPDPREQGIFKLKRRLRRIPTVSPQSFEDSLVEERGDLF